MIMEIGKSGIKTESVAMGTFAIGGGERWGGGSDDEESIRTIHRAIDLGIKWFDTAPVYGKGHSEEVVGKALKGKRDQVILSTKCGLVFEKENHCFHVMLDGSRVFRDCSPKAIREGLEESLLRMGTDYIDVLYTHWQEYGPEATPIADTVGEMIRLRDEGKIRAIGASNVNAQQIEDYVAAGGLDVIQEKYNMLDRKNEVELFPTCEKLGVSMQTYAPLEMGLLTGKQPLDRTFKPGDIRYGKRFWEPEYRKNVHELLDGWKDLCEKYGVEVGNLVIAWTTTRMNSISVLCGARRLNQIEENAKAVGLDLDAADIARMNKDLDAMFAAGKIY